MAEFDGFTLDWEEEEPITAQNNFTDRDDFKKILREAVETPQLISERRVKVFYGAGGQGKSALKNDFFIKDYLRVIDDKHIIYTDKVDFEYQEGTRLPDEALLRIAEDLIEKGNIPLPAFCLGFLRYKMQTSAEKNIQRDYPFLYKIKFIENDLGSEIFNTVIGATLELINSGSQMLPGLGFFTRKVADKAHRKIVEWIQLSDAKRVLGDIDELTSLELLQRLPLLLAYDINKYLKQHLEREQPFVRKRIIIMIDGYEALWRNVINPEIDKDNWVRTLVEKTPGVLFVFFGRDKIRWAEKNDAFEKILDQHLIKGLSDEDAALFLQRSGVEEDDVRAKIIDTSKNSTTPEDGCLPFYLDLQVHTYRKIKQSGKSPSPDDFSNNNGDVIGHFFEHLHPEVSGAIKALSLAPYIDEEIIELYVANNFILPNAISLKSLARHSFIRMENNRAMIHGLMKEMSAAQFRADYKLRHQRINEVLFSHFNATLPNKQQQLQPDIEKQLELAAHHLEQTDRHALVNWVWEKVSLLYGNEVYGVLTNVLEKATNYLFTLKREELQQDEITMEDFSLSELHCMADIRYWLANQYDWAWNYSAARHEISECLRIVNHINAEGRLRTEDPLPEDSRQQLKKIITLKAETLELQASILLSLDHYMDAGDAYFHLAVLSAEHDVDFDRYAYANYLTSIGRFSEAEPIYIKRYFSLKKRIEAHPEDTDTRLSLVYNLRDISNIMRDQQRYDEALRFHEEAIRHIGQVEYSPIVRAMVLRGTSITLVRQGKEIERAEKLFDEAYEIYRRTYDEENIIFGYLYSELSSLYLVKQDFERAIELFAESGNRIVNYFGKGNRAFYKNAFETVVYADKLYKSGNVDESIYFPLARGAKQLMRTEFENLKSLFGVSSPLLHQAIEIAAMVAEKDGEHEVSRRWLRARDEFKRLTQLRATIRCDHLQRRTLDQTQKERFIQLFKNELSLPARPEDIALTEIHLPFYHTFKLYELIYKNTPLPVVRYLLSDGEQVELLDYTGLPINRAQKQDGRIDSDTVFDYLTFISDNFSWSSGFLYFIPHPDDIPWRIDIDVTPEQKSRVTSIIQPYRVLEDDDERIVVRLFKLVQCFIYRLDATVYKKELIHPETGAAAFYRGYVELGNLMMAGFDQSGQPFFVEITKETMWTEISKIKWYDHEGKATEPQDYNQLEFAIHARVDPEYSNYLTQKNNQEVQQVSIAMDICRRYLEFMSSFVPDDDVEAGEFRDEVNRVAHAITTGTDITNAELTYVITQTIEIMDILIEGLRNEVGDDDLRVKVSTKEQLFLKRLIEEMNPVENEESD